MTIKQAKEILRTHGMVLRRTANRIDFRVNSRGGTEAEAYYTPDLDDAVEFGIARGKRLETISGTDDGFPK